MSNRSKDQEKCESSLKISRFLESNSDLKDLMTAWIARVLLGTYAWKVKQTL
jgi:hypothetical protein